MRIDSVFNGVEIGDAARAYPIAELGDSAIDEVVGGVPVVIFSQELGPLATAYDPPSRAEC